MKKKLFLAIIFILTMSVYASADVYSNAANDISKRLTTTEGIVSDVVNNNEVILNKGSDDGLYKNSFVYIYRPLGTFKTFGEKSETIKLKKGVAYAYIKTLSPHSSKAVIVHGVEEEKEYLIGLGIIPYGKKDLIGKPEKKDRWIAGKKQYRVAVITRNPHVFQSFSNALSKTGKFYTIDPDTLSIAITKSRINSLGEAESVKKLSDAVNADLIVLVSIKRYKQLSYKVYSGYSGHTLLSNTIDIDKNNQEVLLAKKNDTDIPANNIVASNLRLSPKLTFWESLLDKAGLYSPYTGLDMSSSTYKIASYKNIGHGTTAFYVGDVNGNGEKDILIAQGSKVYIYNYDIDSFEKKGEFSYGYNIYNIDSVKMGDKILVALSNFNSYGSVDSSLGYIDMNYKFHIIKDDIPYSIRFYDRFNKPVLIAQAASVKKVFKGDIYKLDVESGKIEKLNLPVKPNSLFNFEKIDNYIAYVSNSSQLCLYDTISGKIKHKTAYSLGYGERGVERYHYEANNEESIHDVEKRNNAYISKSVVFFRGKENSIYALGLRNYLSHTIAINKQAYDAYSLTLLKYDAGNFDKVWNSGDVRGRVVGIGKIDDDIISVIGLPATFFSRFIKGIDEVDRLSAGQMEY